MDTDSDRDRRRTDRLQMRRGWVHFLIDIEPERPRLFRYCRKLTGSVWDAEDLLQSTLLKAFGSIALLDDEQIRWGPYLARIASNHWIDQKRKVEPLALDAIAEPATPPSAEGAVALRDGGRTLMTRLSPQERCAFVMKEVFELTLAEIAALLETTEGAIKAALHRGREKLVDPAPCNRPVPSEALVQRFVDAFNAADLDAIKATMLETVTAEVLALGTGHGLDEISQPNRWIYACLHGHTPDPTRQQRAECVTYDGEPIVIVWRRFGGGSESLEEIWRFRQEEERIAHIWDYCACPETLTEVAGRLGHPVKTRPYSTYYHGWMEEEAGREADEG